MIEYKVNKKCISTEGCNVFLYRFDPYKAATSLEWALKYWRAEREPEPEKRINKKCFSCPLNATGLCEFALERPDPKFAIQKGLSGDVIVSRA
jgi:hypothetical protein